MPNCGNVPMKLTLHRHHCSSYLVLYVNSNSQRKTHLLFSLESSDFTISSGLLWNLTIQRQCQVSQVNHSSPLKIPYRITACLMRFTIRMKTMCILHLTWNQRKIGFAKNKKQKGGKEKIKNQRISIHMIKKRSCSLESLTSSKLR